MVTRRASTTVSTALRSPASRFLAKRLVKAVFILLLASSAIFAAGDLLPSDVCRQLLGRFVTPESYAACRQEMGLDRLAIERYFRWVGGVVQGDFGLAPEHSYPHWRNVDSQIWHSTVLLAFAFLWAVPAGMVAGVWARRRPQSIANRLTWAAQMLGRSVPEFLIWVLLIMVFAVVWELLPSSASAINEGEGPLANPENMVLPCLMIGLWGFAHTLRVVRDKVTEDGGVLLAGISALPGLAWRALGSLIFVELIFFYPGLGLSLPYSILQADATWFRSVASLIVMAYVLVDLVSGLLTAALKRRMPEDDLPSSRPAP